MKAWITRFTVLEKGFIAAAVCLWLLFIVISVRNVDALKWRMRRLSSSGSIDCGRSLSEATELTDTAVDACVVSAYKARKPFYARYDADVVDDMWRSHTIISTAIVGKDKGQVYFLYERHDPCGKHNFRRQYLCPQPKVVTDFEGTHLTCSTDSCE